MFFEDEEIEFYLELNLYDVRYAAAELLDVWASDEAMVTKAVKLLDISTNGPAVASALREHASRLRAQADKAAFATDSGFDIAELALGPWALREQIINEGLADD